MKTLNDKVLVITGAGSGIGRALAVRAAGQGARLAISDVNAEGLDETARQAKDAGSPEVQSLRLDVSDREAFGAYAELVVEQFGRVDAVVNNAGVALHGDFEDMDYSEIEWIVGVNYWGVVHGSKEFLPHLIASGDGHLVNVSSLFGLISMPGQSAYNATKYAVRGMSEAIREEMIVAGHPVAVSVVHPGGIKTGIARNSRVTKGQDQASTAKFFDEKLAKMTPEKAAQIILDGMLASKPRIIVGMDAHALFTLSKVVGPRYQDIVARTARKVLPRTTAR
ncbi:SDR family NAD(P)-dependent oxidoreductase [Nocardioidaceae bacterium]|nr:SDR family NAD(P)-dependent oxidoreductase [Nocardioidaceae bacterium]